MRQQYGWAVSERMTYLRHDVNNGKEKLIAQVSRNVIQGWSKTRRRHNKERLAQSWCPQ